MATTSAERMRRLREQRLERLLSDPDTDLRELSDSELLDRLAAAFRRAFDLEVRDIGAELYRRASERRKQMGRELP